MRAIHGYCTVSWTAATLLASDPSWEVQAQVLPKVYRYRSSSGYQTLSGEMGSAAGCRQVGLTDIVVVVSAGQLDDEHLGLVPLRALQGRGARRAAAGHLAEDAALAVTVLRQRVLAVYWGRSGGGDILLSACN